MNQTPQTILNKVLDIINYQDDKEEFIKQFISLANQQAIANLISQMPQDQQDSLQEKVNNTSDSTEITKISQDFFNTKDLEASLNHSLEANFEKFLQDIKPTLSANQLKELEDFFEEESL